MSKALFLRFTDRIDCISSAKSRFIAHAIPMLIIRILIRSRMTPVSLPTSDFPLMETNQSSYVWLTMCNSSSNSTTFPISSGGIKVHQTVIDTWSLLIGDMLWDLQSSVFSITCLGICAGAFFQILERPAD